MEAVVGRMGAASRQVPKGDDGTVVRTFRPSFSNLPTEVVFGPTGKIQSFVTQELTVEQETLPHRAGFEHVRQLLGQPTYYWSGNTKQHPMMVYARHNLQVFADWKTYQVLEYRLFASDKGLQLPGEGYYCSQEEFEELVLHQNSPPQATLHPKGHWP